MMLLDRAAPGDRARARALLAEALESYQQIGMPRHSELAQELLSWGASTAATIRPPCRRPHV
jgi:hypothetical protein